MAQGIPHRRVDALQTALLRPSVDSAARFHGDGIQVTPCWGQAVATCFSNRIGTSVQQRRRWVEGEGFLVRV